MWSSENIPGSRAVLAEVKYVTKFNRTEEEFYFCDRVDSDSESLKLGDEV